MKKAGVYVLAALGVAAYNYVNTADRDGSGAIVSAGAINVFDIQAGDCFDDGDGFGAVDTVPGVPCDEPHDNEAYAVFEVNYSEYPGEAVMWEKAHDACLDRFEGFVGRDYESSELDVFTLYPSDESWRQNDREVVCAVYDIDYDKLTGSVEGRGL